MQQHQRTSTAYMITERTYAPPVDIQDPDYETVNRRVVETVPEARAFVSGLVQGRIGTVGSEDIQGKIDDDGTGTVTLPDMSTITVEPIEWRAVAADADPHAIGKEAIVLSFNRENWR